MPPKNFLNRSSDTKKYFNELPNGSYRLKVPNNGQMNGLPKFRKLHEIIGVYNGGKFFHTQNFKTLKNSKEKLFFKNFAFKKVEKLFFLTFCVSQSQNIFPI